MMCGRWQLHSCPKRIAAGIGRRRSTLRELHSVRSPSRIRPRPRSLLEELTTVQSFARHNTGNRTAATVTDAPSHERGIRNRNSLGLRRDENRVLIVGGGPTGLFLAHLLRSYNVPFRLVEAQTPEGRFQHPQAHFLNTRTMEILKHGLSYCNDHNGNPNEPNDIYRRLRGAMPPVEEWKSFRFGPDMTCNTLDGKILAEVVHPVDRPLAATEDANGRLVPESAAGDHRTPSTARERGSGTALSPESVGHLAQHTFCRILYDALVDSPDDEVMYERRATGFDWNEETRLWNVQTDRGDLFDDVDVIVAADGAASSIRKNLFPGDGTRGGNDSTMLGTHTLQRLINVHFTVSEETTSIPPAMLYTIFNTEVLAMCVRHGPGEFVLQIPYFEPYQTPEDDFGIESVRKMIGSILGNSNGFTIHSIRPWTMGSLVARKYHTDNGVFLAGDAAHVFPPAGGFGMNTGLQDVYSLAWQIAFNRQTKQNPKDRTSNNEDGNSTFSSLSEIGRTYERERQPVARRNAALSVRNYNRVLNVMRACYLDDRHPAFLIQALDATASFVPLEARRQTFRTLLKTALSPLSQLESSPDGIYAQTIKGNLRSLLGSGQGLPLLFPRYELDFSYGAPGEHGTSVDGEDEWSQDSVASFPRLVVGGLFPHIVASVEPDTLLSFPRLQPIDNGEDNANGRNRFIVTGTTADELRTISTRDLPAQLATDETPCAFCIVEIVSSTGVKPDDTLPSLQKSLQGKLGIPILMSRLTVYSNSDGDQATLNGASQIDVIDTSICDMHMDAHQWEDLNLIPGLSEPNSSFKMFVVVRPDGHVAAISSEVPHLENLVLGMKAFLQYDK
ncbi:unnamed protein product [Pseudo-nitzschia multistriata]|uniref:FAD-binding domain-containing protein n=1 Tax=Pseudo-nitzschia multistriata TaxID=183589 RepID=A0A448Z3G4_9STRA|nr:unnamed protein product [Pseudo-nitzschia multistriata]